MYRPRLGFYTETIFVLLDSILLVPSPLPVLLLFLCYALVLNRLYEMLVLLRAISEIPNLPCGGYHIPHVP